jgi:hypothetical protein
MRHNPGLVAFSQSTTLLVLVGVWLFLAGWTYVSSYLMLLHITSAQIFVPTNIYMTYGKSVVVEHVWSCMAIFLAFGIQSYFLWRLNLSTMRSFVVIVYFLICLFISAQIFGKAAAHRLYEENIFNIHLTGTQYHPAANQVRPQYVEIIADWGGNPGQDAAIGSVKTAHDLASGCYVSVWTDTNSVYLVKVRPIIEWHHTPENIWHWGGQTKSTHGIPFSTIRVSLDSIRVMKISEKPPRPCTKAE